MPAPYALKRFSSQDAARERRAVASADCCEHVANFKLPEGQHAHFEHDVHPGTPRGGWVDATKTFGSIPTARERSVEWFATPRAMEEADTIRDDDSTVAWFYRLLRKRDRRNPRNSRWRSSSGSGSRVASFMLLPRRSSLLLGDTPVERHDLPALPSQLENVHGPQYVGDRPRLRGARKEFRARVSPCHLGRCAQLHRRALHRMPRSRHLGHQVIVAKVLPIVVAMAVLEHDDVVCDQRRNTGHVMVLQSALEAGHDIPGRVLWT